MSVETHTRNLLTDYYEWFPHVALLSNLSNAVSVQGSENPRIEFKLPFLDGSLKDFFKPATAGWSSIGDYCGRDLCLLDLMRNPAAQTTKTYASYLMVARAIEHVRTTGESVVFFTPTSGNKGIALRDAVERAICIGLVSPDELRIVTLAPKGSVAKFRKTLLVRDPDLRRANPLLLYDGCEPSDVKALLLGFITQHGKQFETKKRAKIWYSLDIKNYLVADAARALMEYDVSPTVKSGVCRLHAHAVSSAFGLLGYRLGRLALESKRLVRAEDQPGFYLVQHLNTPDMVLDLLKGSSLAEFPQYSFVDVAQGYTQAENPHFPFFTRSVTEVLDPTFYTRSPTTIQRMTALVRRFGGGGIVVSLDECLERYSSIREILRDTSIKVPLDPLCVREWSLIMAMTGVLNAIDRNLIRPKTEIVIHASGFYTSEDYEMLSPEAALIVSSIDEIAACLN